MLLGLLVFVGVGVGSLAAFATVPSPPPKTALFANDPGCSTAGITLSGSSNSVINGYSHSNGAFNVSGSKNTFGPADAVCTPTVSGSGNTFNGASKPGHEQSLGFPETYSQSTVCSQPGVHSATSFAFSSGTPSGIYCASSSISLSESHLTATVTFVAPTIALSGTSDTLSPAYQDLLVYDTNTSSSSSFSLSGSSDVTHGATIYAPNAGVSVSGSGLNFDGMIEADTIVISGSSQTFTGEGPPPIGQNFTISGNATGLLYPGAAGQQLNLMFNNPNTESLSVSNITIGIGTITAPHATGSLPCTSADFSYTQYSGTYPFTIPVGSSSLSSDSGAPSSKWPSVAMVNRQDSPPHSGNGNQDGCIGATVTLNYSGTATGA